MSYGTGRFSNLDLPNPTLSYVARKAFKHHDLAFQPGDPVTVEQLGTRHLTKYIRARLVELPVMAGDAVPPEAGAALLQEPRASGAGQDDMQQGVAGPEDATPIERPAPSAVDIHPSTMSKGELFDLIDARGLQVDKRLPLGALRAKVAAALEG